MSQSHCVTIDFPIKGPANAKALTEELPPLMLDFAKKQDKFGTVHFSRFIVEGTKSCFSFQTSTVRSTSILSDSWRVLVRCLTPS